MTLEEKSVRAEAPHHLILEDRERLTVSGVECYSFPYRRETGRWVFTDFQLVY